MCVWFCVPQAGTLERPSEVSVPKDEVALRLAWEQARVLFFCWLRLKQGICVGCVVPQLSSTSYLVANVANKELY